MNDSHTQPAGWKRKIVHEVIEYLFTFGYLAFFFAAFAWYRRLILAANDVTYTHYWFPLLKAAVLAKVIMLGDLLGLGRGLERRPLILPTVCRAVTFSLWVGLFELLEATVRGLLDGQGPMGGLEEIASEGRYELLAACVVMFAAFIPFFAFKELGRVLGNDKLRALFWGRRNDAVTGGCP